MTKEEISLYPRLKVPIRRPIPVTQIATHRWMHWDEGVASYLAKNYGSDFFPGIETAGLIFWGVGGTPDGRPADAWIQMGTLPVGIGGGPFDEHYTTGLEERKPYNCAATLMADYMGIRYSDELKDLVRYTLETDEDAIQRPFSIPSIVKVVNLLYNDQPGEVYRWMEVAIKAHIQGKLRQHKSPGEYRTAKKTAPTLDLVFADYLANFHSNYGSKVEPRLENSVARYLEAVPGDSSITPMSWFEKNFPDLDFGRLLEQQVTEKEKPKELVSVALAKFLDLFDYPAFEQILKYISEGKNPPRSLASQFELENVIQDVFLLHNGDNAETLKWTRSAIAAKVFGQQYFQDCKQQFKEAEFETVRASRRWLKIAFIRSDNPMMIQYFRSDHAAEAYGRTDILVQQSSRGNIQLFADNARCKTLNLDDVVRVLRIYELREKGLALLHSTSDLAQEGLGPDKVFYYFKRANQILNAPLSAPDMPVTKQSFEQIKARVKFAFNQKSFPIMFASECLKGKCTSSRQKPCMLFPARLMRCRRVRNEVGKVR